MATVSTYLNFTNNTEEAFNYYKSIFGGEFVGGISRFRDMPPMEGMPPLAEQDKTWSCTLNFRFLAAID